MAKRGLVIVLAFVVLFFASSLAFAQVETVVPDKPMSPEINKEQVVALATEAVKAQGFKLEDANIIYDEGGKLWSEKIGKVVTEDTTGNYGILKKGFLKNYRIVYFDYKEPVPDIWVFIDKDTGEVLTVYREEPAK